MSSISTVVYVRIQETVPSHIANKGKTGTIYVRNRVDHLNGLTNGMAIMQSRAVEIITGRIEIISTGQLRRYVNSKMPMPTLLRTASAMMARPSSGRKWWNE